MCQIHPNYLGWDPSRWSTNSFFFGGLPVHLIKHISSMFSDMNFVFRVPNSPQLSGMGSQQMEYKFLFFWRPACSFDDLVVRELLEQQYQTTIFDPSNSYFHPSRQFLKQVTASEAAARSSDSERWWTSSRII